MRFRCLVVSLALYAAFASDSWGQSQQPSPRPSEISHPKQSQSQTSPQQTTEDLRGTEKAPVVVNVLPAPRTLEEAKQDAQDRQDKATLEWRTLLLTSITTIVLVLQLFVFGLQARRLNQTVKAMKDSEIRQLRAYVSINPKMMNGFGGTNRIQIECMTKNHGQTPAFDINHVFDMDVFPNPMPDNFVFPVPSQPVAQDQGLFPGGDMKTWFNNPRLLSSAEIDEIEAGSKFLWVWGSTFYRDAFDKKRETPFKFCAGGPAFAASVKAVRQGKPDPGFGWAYGTGHNQGT
jgi:hypothetical protein